MIEGNFVVVPAAVVAIAWIGLAIRNGYGPVTIGVGLVAIGHLAAVAAVTLFPLPVQRDLIEDRRALQVAHNNVIPLVSLVDALATGNHPSVIDQSVGNLALLAPLGIYGPMLSPRLRPFLVTVAAGVCLSCLIELAQLGISTYLGFTYKLADVDDVIMNTAGVAPGCLRGRGEGSQTRRRSAAQRVSSYRFESWSLRRTADTCVSTVFTEMCSSCATSLYV